jgi:hypothetical protein
VRCPFCGGRQSSRHVLSVVSGEDEDYAEEAVGAGRGVWSRGGGELVRCSHGVRGEGRGLGVGEQRPWGQRIEVERSPETSMP